MSYVDVGVRANSTKFVRGLSVIAITSCERGRCCAPREVRRTSQAVLSDSSVNLRRRSRIERRIQVKLTNARGLANAADDIDNFCFDDVRHRPADHGEGAWLVAHAL